MRFPRDLTTLDRLELGLQTIVFLIDETGDETRTDPAQPFFGIGGCGVLARDMEALINRPWREVRSVINGSTESPLHAADMRPPFESAHTAALSSFFARYPFMRFGVSCDLRTKLPPSFELTQAMLLCLQGRLNQLLQWTWGTDVAVIFEHSERMEAAVRRGFESFCPHQFGRVLDWIPCFLPKSANEPAMEVADFVAHVVGGQARNIQRTGRIDGKRLDFKAVFGSADPMLSNYFHVREVRWLGA